MVFWLFWCSWATDWCFYGTTHQNIGILFWSAHHQPKPIISYVAFGFIFPLCITLHPVSESAVLQCCPSALRFCKMQQQQRSSSFPSCKQMCWKAWISVMESFLCCNLCWCLWALTVSLWAESGPKYQISLEIPTSSLTPGAPGIPRHSMVFPHLRVEMGMGHRQLSFKHCLSSEEWAWSSKNLQWQGNHLVCLFTEAASQGFTLVNELKCK